MWILSNHCYVSGVVYISYTNHHYFMWYLILFFLYTHHIHMAFCFHAFRNTIRSYGHRLTLCGAWGRTWICVFANILRQMLRKSNGKNEMFRLPRRRCRSRTSMCNAISPDHIRISFVIFHILRACSLTDNFPRISLTVLFSLLKT